MSNSAFRDSIVGSSITDTAESCARFGLFSLSLFALRLTILALAGVALAACDSSEEPSAPNAPISQSQPSQPGPQTKTPVPSGSGFDFYVLSLSWSPSYCEAEGRDANRQQCAAGRPYAFVVHGLWPQFERGFPQDCRSDRPDVSDITLRSLYDIMPSAGLIRHQWRKHGSCSGLSQNDYFAVLREARERVQIPSAFSRLNSYRTVSPLNVEQSFVQSNALLPEDGIAITCDKRYLREVRICMTKQLEFRSCPEVDRRSCRMPKAVMPPVRGG
ncbi:MAG: ribonuclease [Rhizobiaceae bacterium]|nr:ribonuclease [Rhizobiaceae bacterium]